ncbi:MAG: beta-propeller domain-containing protein [Eubacterium sp.]
MNNDFEYLKEKFDNANLQVPDGLDKKVFQKLDSPRKKIPFVKTRAFKAIVSLAACFAVFVASFSAVKIADSERVLNNKTQGSQPAVMQTFGSEDELNEYVEKIIKDNKSNFAFGLGLYTNKGADSIEESAADSAYGSSTEVNHGETYLQEKDVDEADTIKTDGKYIYKSCEVWKDDYSESYIAIFEAKDGKTKQVGKISFKTSYNNNASKYISRNIMDFYIKGDRLVAQANSFYYDKDIGETAQTECLVYDISDVYNPKKVYSFAQKGGYASSRMVGDTLYLVSNYGYNNYYYDKNYVIDDTIMPSYSENEKSSCIIEPTDIAYTECKGDDFTVVSAIDTKKGKRIGKTKSVIGAGSEVYCTTEHLYIIGNDYSGVNEKTFIAKINLDNGVEFGPSCKINGRFDSQYSFSEIDGTFFACVTNQNTKLGKDYNYLYAFDENLNRIGRTESFGADESVRAVRYIGDYAYVITYKQTDPLFVIDISNPKDMQIKGSVKITGFSTMLIPIGDNRLLGIGNATDSVEDSDMEYISGIKLALFDISNPQKPKVLDSRVYRDMYSEAQYNPKALIINEAKDYMAIPMDDADYNAGAVVFSVNGDEIQEKCSFDYQVNDEDYFGNSRITYIGDYIYSFDNCGNVHSFLVK